MRKVELRIEVNCPPEKIIAAFTELEMLSDWWKVERALIDKKAGGVYTLAWNISEQGFGYISTGIIEKYDPKSCLVLKNMVYLNPDKPILGPMSLTVKAKAKGNGSEMNICQSGYQTGPHWDWYYQAVQQAWPSVGKSLKEYLEK